MYAYIKGTLEETGEDYIVVEAGGIGYQIFTTGQTFQYLPSMGEEVKVCTYLLGVSGIGPKGALAILSVMTTDDLRFAVLGDDAKAIAKAPGVGAKTAQRLILELKDKLSLEDAFEQKLAKNDNPVQNKAKGAKNEAIEALVALGYSSSEALKALNGIEITDDTDVEDILKAALKNMAFM